MTTEKDEILELPFRKIRLADMTLRDYFAAKAMQAILTEEGMAEGINSIHHDAERAYLMANVMLAERQK